MKDYDVVIIGAGPAGIFTALELADTGASILILEKGHDIHHRLELNKDPHGDRSEKRMNIVCGWGGAGAFSDGKLTLTTEYGGNLEDYMHKGELASLISYVDDVYCHYGGKDRKVYGDEFARERHELKRKAAAADLSFIPARIRHLGTDVKVRFWRICGILCRLMCMYSAIHRWKKFAVKKEHISFPPMEKPIALSIW